MNTSTKSRSIWRKLLLAIAGLVFATVAFGTWYKVHYAMDMAAALSVPGAPGAPRVLIATQGSHYKDAVTAGLVEHLKGRSATIEVIDVADLGKVKPEQWNAIVVIHTWEMDRPPVEVEEFINGLPSRGKLVVHTTSGQGDAKLDGVDAVSGASNIEDAGEKVRELAARVDAVLAK